MAKNEKETSSVQTATTDVQPEALNTEATLREELVKVRAQLDEVSLQLAKEEQDKQALAAELLVVQSADKSAKQIDTRESILVRTANAAEFWRGGVLFTGEWQEVKRADVGETNWARIVSEAALQTKQVE